MNEISRGCETCTFKGVCFFSAQSGQIMKGWKYICTARNAMKRELWLFWERATRCYYPILRPRWVNVWLVCRKGLSSKFRGTSFYSHSQMTHDMTGPPVHSLGLFLAAGSSLRWPDGGAASFLREPQRHHRPGAAVLERCDRPSDQTGEEGPHCCPWKQFEGDREASWGWVAQ